MSYFDYEAFSILSGLIMDGELHLRDCVIKEVTFDNENIKEIVKWNLTNIHYSYSDFHDSYSFLKTLGLNYIVNFHCKIGFEMEYDGDRYIYDETDIEKQKQFLYVLITCFRLFKKGIVGTNYVTLRRLKKHSQNNEINIVGIGRRVFLDIQRYDPFNKTLRGYKIESTQKEEFIIFYNKYGNKVKHAPKNVNKSIEWLNKSYTEINVENIILSLIISLETLYKTGSIRLILRCTYNLTEDPNEREKIYNNLDKAIDLRHSIVHGASPDKEECDRLIHIIKQYLRESILIFLDYDNPTVLLNNLDMKIKRGI